MKNRVITVHVRSQFPIGARFLKRGIGTKDQAQLFAVARKLDMVYWLKKEHLLCFQVVPWTCADCNYSNPASEFCTHCGVRNPITRLGDPDVNVENSNDNKDGVQSVASSDDSVAPVSGDS